jgi:hypothetical protein
MSFSFSDRSFSIATALFSIAVIRFAKGSWGLELGGALISGVLAVFYERLDGLCSPKVIDLGDRLDRFLTILFRRNAFRLSYPETELFPRSDV